MRPRSPNIAAQRFTNGGRHTSEFGPDGRLKQLDQGLYTQKDAEAAIGLSTDRGEVKGAMMDLG